MDCVFCAIVAGAIGCRKLDEDDHAIAFLDIAPWHTGHTLVVPKRHVIDLTADPSVLVEIAPLISAVSRRLVGRLHADGLNLMSSAGAAAGQEVFHMHVHLVPRYSSAPGLRGLLVRDAQTDLDAVLARLLAVDQAS